MSREVKFRYWHNEKHMMVYFDHPCVRFSDNACKLVFGQDFHDDFCSHEEDASKGLMQHVGLKDKNGKEIYEGDIVQARVDYCLGDVKEFMHVVGFGEDGLLRPFYGWVNFGAQVYIDALEDGFEVIGNIHENPGLVQE